MSKDQNPLITRLRDPKLIGHEVLREEAALEIELLQDREARLRAKPTDSPEVRLGRLLHMHPYAAMEIDTVKDGIVHWRVTLHSNHEDWHVSEAFADAVVLLERLAQNRVISP